MSLPKKLETTIFWPDTHCPHFDRRAVNIALNLVQKVKPDRIVIMGDFLDFMSVSRWDRDPRHTKNLQEEINDAERLLEKIRKVSGKRCQIIYVEGNHEYRLTKYLVTRADSLVWLKRGEDDILSVPYLLQLRDKGIKWVPYESSLTLHDWVFEHGNAVSQWSAFTAKKMVDKRLKNIGIAHTHRMGHYLYTSFDKVLQGVEFGCLIDRNSPAASYSKYPNWQIGFGIGQWSKEDKLFQVSLLPIIDYKLIWNGKVYKS